jgi:hypothetical protein
MAVVAGCDPVGLVQQPLKVAVRGQLEGEPQRPLAVGRRVWMTSVIGSPLWTISAADEGCSLAGAVMSTPAIGTAIVGLSGFALVACWQAAATSTRPEAAATESTQPTETSPYRATIGRSCAELYGGTLTVRWEGRSSPYNTSCAS